LEDEPASQFLAMWSDGTWSAGCVACGWHTARTGRHEAEAAYLGHVCQPTN